jgi:hypothetical protein
MRKTGGFIVAAVLVTAGMGLWSSSVPPARGNIISGPRAAGTMTALEVHLKTDTKNLPTQGKDQDAI